MLYVKAVPRPPGDTYWGAHPDSRLFEVSADFNDLHLGVSTVDNQDAFDDWMRERSLNGHIATVGIDWDKPPNIRGPFQEPIRCWILAYAWWYALKDQIAQPTGVVVLGDIYILGPNGKTIDRVSQSKRD